MSESQSIEYKESWRDEFLSEICAFANAQGGSLYIGINDKGIVTGVKDSKKLLEVLPNSCRNRLGIIPDVNLYEKDGLDYIEITVTAYPIAISFNGNYYYRSGSTTQKLVGAELDSFILRKRGATWDNLPLPSFQYSDIDESAVRHFAIWAEKKGRLDSSILSEPMEVLMKRLHLVSNGFLTNAGMLMFAKDPEEWQQGAYIKLGFFETDADLRYQDEIHGPLLQQVDKAIEILHLKYMKAIISYDGIHRREHYIVPDEALREALLNAVCHKDYSSGIPIQVSVYDDKLYIANCGRLPETWEMSRLFEKHASNPYNPNIAHVFYLAGYVESWGRGIEKIVNDCKQDGSPVPEYTVHPGDIMIKFTARKDRVLHLENISVTSGVTDEVTDRVTDGELRVLQLLSIDPGIPYTALANKLEVSKKTIAEKISSLKSKGIIERVGNNKRGYWKINH